MNESVLHDDQPRPTEGKEDLPNIPYSPVADTTFIAVHRYPSSSRPTSNATIMSIVHVPIDSTTAVSKLAHLRLVCQKVGHTRKLHGQTEKLVVLSSLIVLDQHLRKPERLLTLETLLDATNIRWQEKLPEDT